MTTYTSERSRQMPANGRNSMIRVHTLLAEAGVELPGTRFNVTHFGRAGSRGVVVVNAPINRRERAAVWFLALKPLLPWTCTMELDERRGTITIKPTEGS